MVRLKCILAFPRLTTTLASERRSELKSVDVIDVHFRSSRTTTKRRYRNVDSIGSMTSTESFCSMLFLVFCCRGSSINDVTHIEGFSFLIEQLEA